MRDPSGRKSVPCAGLVCHVGAITGMGRPGEKPCPLTMLAMRGVIRFPVSEIPERGVRYEPQAPLPEVIGPPLASDERPVAEGVRPSTAAPRPAKIPLPRFGEMEKRFDDATRKRLGL
ncbi:MAG: hypothetical protein WBL20_09545 [Sphingobium sp.]|uniref:hypothetical protein n=1 Tax=Sphingobium sp. TaxID=1912891 RepID=UPI003BB04513